MGKQLLNFAIAFFGGVDGVIEYALTHVFGTAKGEKAWAQIKPVIDILQAGGAVPSVSVTPATTLGSVMGAGQEIGGAS